MGVYIEGMEMPKNCAECFFHKVFPATGVGINQLYCALCGINIVKLSDAQPDCPLVPVPPHGRLIDADALSAKLNTMLSMTFGEGNTAFYFAYRSLGKMVENAPTIIPAEEDEI